jgi:hypothetical protein
MPANASALVRTWSFCQKRFISMGRTVKKAMSEKAEKTSNWPAGPKPRLAVMLAAMQPMPRQNRKKPGRKISAIIISRAKPAHQCHWKKSMSICVGCEDSPNLPVPSAGTG